MGDSPLSSRFIFSWACNGHGHMGSWPRHSNRYCILYWYAILSSCNFIAIRKSYPSWTHCSSFVPPRSSNGSLGPTLRVSRLLGLVLHHVHATNWSLSELPGRKWMITASMKGMSNTYYLVLSLPCVLCCVKVCHRLSWSHGTVKQWMGPDWNNYYRHRDYKCVIISAKTIGIQQ